jgi:abortive infection alpha-like protein
MSSERTQLAETAPAVARLAVGLSWRATRWSVAVSVRTGKQLTRASIDPVLLAQVAAELGADLREHARDLLGVTELDERVRQLMPPDESPSSNGKVAEAVALRIKGALLLRAAADVDAEDDAHPAYARILTELVPDEGRILRLLATDGPQPSVDVRATNLIGISSDLVAAGLNMVGAAAGVSHADRVPAYLNNLERLGLVWFSREPLEAPGAYQLLEAQPDVLAAIQRAPRARTTQRSIVLTPFGRDFCDVCLPLDADEVHQLAGDQEGD